MIEAVWRKEFASMHKGVNAQKVAQEILAIGDDADPHRILNAARNENSELHKCFTWDNTVAAEKWRLHEARQITYHLVIRKNNPEQEKLPQIRYFYKTDSGGYKPTEMIFHNMDEHQKLLLQAYKELQAFKRKYSCLQELSEILALID